MEGPLLRLLIPSRSVNKHGRSLNRGPSIDAFDQVSVHLAKRFQMRRILEIDQSETRIVSGSHVW
jgi:hypothetical protein